MMMKVEEILRCLYLVPADQVLPSPSSRKLLYLHCPSLIPGHEHLAVLALIGLWALPQWGRFPLPMLAYPGDLPS